MKPNALSDQQSDQEITFTADGFNIRYDGRRYELKGIEKPSPARLKATVKALNGEAGRFHIDTVDFYLSRSRRGFVVEAARFFKENPLHIEEDLTRLIIQLEGYVEKQKADALPLIPQMTEKDQAEGRKLGTHPDLIGEILRDMDSLGLVGERINKLTGYLAMTSRKMDDPLSLLILSGSGSGKSHLQDVILSLCPEEDRITLTTLSDRALFYKGEHALAHKALAIEEEKGAAGAHYAIRNLISSKKLVIETTVKNGMTGRLETQVNIVRGPTAVFQTTTNPETDAETRSRFIVTSVDESTEQTRAILESQRHGHTMEGLIRKKQRELILVRHHVFQRMLKPVKVVNPYEPLLTYGDDRLLFRRDHPKYLRLILTVAFLHQMQRTVKPNEMLGDYIEVTLDDIAVANELASELFSQSLDDLSAPSRRLLQLITDHARARSVQLQTEIAKVEFSRRELREVFKWSETTLRTHLAELLNLGYLVRTSGRHGQLYCYRLACEPKAEPTAEIGFKLKAIEQLRIEATGKGILTESKSLASPINQNFADTSPMANGEVYNGCFHSESASQKVNFAASREVLIREIAKSGKNLP